MELQLNNLLIHELEKEADSADAQVFLTETPVPAGELSQALVERLHETFIQKEDILQGYLSAPEDALFPGAFRVLSEKNFEEEAFIHFSRDTMNALQLSLQKVIGAKGGYLVYADYEVFGARMIGIFLVRDTEGLLFRKDRQEETFQVDTVTYLNTDKLAMACRIHVEKYRAGQTRCLEIIKHARSQKEISEYFLNWIGLDRPESSKEMTSTFLQVVEELPLPVDQQSGEVMPEHRFHQEVYNFAMSNPQKTIHLDEFNEHFYGDDRRTQQYLEDNEVPLDQEFRFDRNTMRKLYYFRSSAEGISLSFNRDHLSNGQVVVDGDKVEIKSPELAKKLMEMLAKG